MDNSRRETALKEKSFNGLSNQSGYCENDSKKYGFFRLLTDEVWFEYDFETQILKLPDKIAAEKGVPQDIYKPQENEKICSFFDGDCKKSIIEALGLLSSKNACCDENIIIKLNGKDTRFRFCVQTEWDKKTGKMKSVFGRVKNIENDMRMFEKIEHSDENTEANDIISVIGSHKIPNFSAHQIKLLMKFFKKMFTIVRLVDPKICMQFAIDSMGEVIEKPYRCYNAWNKTERCERCISSMVAHTHQTATKIEFIDGQVYNISASEIYVDGKSYVLELATHVDHDSMMSAGEKHEVLKTIAVHNSQLYIDPVTGVYNRRYFDDKIRDLEGQFAFAMLDVDNFKQINDTYGHIAGDTALAAVAQTIKGSVRSCDDVIRYGGDEFFLFFRDMPRDVINAKLEKIRRCVEKIHIGDYPDLKLTVSIGGAFEKGKISQILRKADMAMYVAKEKRNSISIYEEI